MIKTDKIRKPQPAVFYIIDYLWSGFAGLSVAMVVVALWVSGDTKGSVSNLTMNLKISTQ